jgi:soluble lytic murein transglycosylase-like protein
MVRPALLATLLCALTPAVAHAQLYSWTDASGRLIISDQPKVPSAKTYLVFGSAATGSFRATKPASAKAAVYDDLIVEHANAHALSPDFVRAVIQAESAFNPRARSDKGAMGLMQLMPATAARYGVYTRADLLDPRVNVDIGVRHLRALHDRYDGRMDLILAAYNAGEGAVERFGQRVPPFPETEEYVRRITTLVGVPETAFTP